MKDKKQFISQSGTITPIVIPEGLLLDSIPTAVYTVKKSLTGFYLELTKKRFKQPSKLYGSTKTRAKRIKHVYNQTDKSTGVLLTGLKGAGKSLLMKEIANQMLKQNMPVIIVQDAFSGSDFMSFMENIGECVVLLDEFGKTYKKDNSDGDNEQHSLLSFFDGVYSSKRLIILAENSTWDISDLFIDRPSRILFHWKYDRLEEDVVNGFCKDNLDKKKFLKPIVAIYRTSKEFTFDSLQAIVSQSNMFKDLSFKDIIDGLNIPLASSEDQTVHKLKVNGEDITNLVDKTTGNLDYGLEILYKKKETATALDNARFGDSRRSKNLPEQEPPKIIEKNLRISITKEDFYSKEGNITTYKTMHGSLEVEVQMLTKEVKFNFDLY